MNEIQFAENQVPEPVKKMGKFKISFSLLKSSWHLLKQDKEMLWLPIISMVFSIGLILLFALPLLIFFITGHSFPAIESMFKNTAQAVPFVLQAGFAFVGIIIFTISFLITVFFNAAIMTIAHARIYGRDLGVRDGLRNAWKYIIPLSLWSLFNATLGALINMITERLGFIGDILEGLFGVIWGFMTYFTVPYIIFENKGVKDSTFASVNSFRKNWGETVIANFSLALAFLPIHIVSILAVIGLVVLSIVTESFAFAIFGGIAWIIVILVVGVLQSVLNSILKVVLFEYANTGTAADGFDEDALKQSIKEKKRLFAKKK